MVSNTKIGQSVRVGWNIHFLLCRPGVGSQCIRQPEFPPFWIAGIKGGVHGGLHNMGDGGVSYAVVGWS